MKLPIEIKVTYEERIDKYIGDNSEISRSDAKKLIKANSVEVNGTEVRKPNFIVRPGTNILVKEVIQREINAEPEDIPIDVVYEDDDLVVINKASGMVVHPAPGHYNGTLVNALLYRFKDLSDINGKVRPGIVHRIDKDTSGLLVVAKNNETHAKLAEELKKHNVKRTYLAWAEGVIPNKITHINLPIGRDEKDRKKMSVNERIGKQSITHVYVETIQDNRTLVRCELETGRTHQIRVHLAYIKHPIIGDPLYGKKIDDFGQRLHATKLQFIHPTTGKEMIFEVEPPKQFNEK